MAGPTIRRRQLGIELQRLREAAGVTRPVAAAAIDCSPARIGHIELGRNVLGKAELIVLLRDHYRVDADTLATLEELRKEASRRGWWSQYGLPEWLAGYVGLEYDATSLRCLELEVIPGLLQTEEYARALHALRGRLSAKEVDRRVGARMQRQERLTDPDRPLHLTVIVSQAALERCARHQPASGAQLAQLVERAQWPNVELLVLPFDLGLHDGMSGPFSVLSFPDGLLADAVYQEYAVGGHVIDDESVVSQLATLFDKLRSQALASDESLTLIAELAKHT
ncbi:MAG: helix-turn-helix domain-containing protein [Actinomycetota bacterium]|nr:helix-turn-helix domain-containing protein [Actinomycetota bacterium]